MDSDSEILNSNEITDINETFSHHLSDIEQDDKVPFDNYPSNVWKISNCGEQSFSEHNLIHTDSNALLSDKENESAKIVYVSSTNRINSDCSLFLSTNTIFIPRSSNMNPNFINAMDVESDNSHSTSTNLTDNVANEKSILLGAHKVAFSASKSCVHWGNNKEQQFKIQDRLRSVSVTHLEPLVTCGSRWKDLKSTVETIQLKCQEQFKTNSSNKALIFHHEPKKTSLTKELITVILKRQEFIELSMEQEQKLEEIKQQKTIKNEIYLTSYSQVILKKRFLCVFFIEMPIT